jgi:hypothetical protein
MSLHSALPLCPPAALHCTYSATTLPLLSTAQAVVLCRREVVLAPGGAMPELVSWNCTAADNNSNNTSLSIQGLPALCSFSGC